MAAVGGEDGARLLNQGLLWGAEGRLLMLVDLVGDGVADDLLQMRVLPVRQVRRGHSETQLLSVHCHQ
jgi:hypothetical protein